MVGQFAASKLGLVSRSLGEKLYVVLLIPSAGFVLALDQRFLDEYSAGFEPIDRAIIYETSLSDHQIPELDGVPRLDASTLGEIRGLGVLTRDEVSCDLFDPSWIDASD